MEVVTIAERAGLGPTVADWFWQEFWRRDGYDLAEAHAAVAAATARTGPTQTFVALLDGRPAGTASLAAEDLDERPALTPWLAGVFVLPPSVAALRDAPDPVGRMTAEAGMAQLGISRERALNSSQSSSSSTAR